MADVTQAGERSGQRGGGDAEPGEDLLGLS
jgi:hypothetical protein